ncbi:MAG: hypothetical protein LUD15_11400 [Bacteroides sp.]|nr:hypothetical protein [Bacteroides sp.]
MVFSQKRSGELVSIFLQLQQELFFQYPDKESRQQVLSVETFIDKIRRKEIGYGDETDKLFKILCQSSGRYRILRQLSEKQHYFLVSTLFPLSKDIIYAYIKGLNRQTVNGVLQGKAGREFCTLKWHFIYQVLTQRGSRSFNEVWFVENTLSGIAARYNVILADLLTYFYHDPVSVHVLFPYALKEALAYLYHTHCTPLSSSYAGRKKQKMVLLSLHRRAVRFIRTYQELVDLSEKDIRRWEEKNYLALFRLEPVLQTLRYLFHSTGQKPDKKILSVLIREILEELYALTPALLLIQLLEQLMLRKSLLLTSELVQQVGKQQEAPALLSESLRRYGERVEKLLSDTTSLSAYTHSSAGPVYTFINNAGIVLLAPFLSVLFTRLGLVENGVFRDHPSRIKAIHAIHRLVYPGEFCNEPDCLLNKLLTGTGFSEPVPPQPDLLPEEIVLVESLPEGVLAHWKKLKNSSSQTLREAFLKREGKLEEQVDKWVLTVEKKSYDMLIDYIPWGFRTLSFPWMPKPLFVQWR